MEWLFVSKTPWEEKTLSQAADSVKSYEVMSIWNLKSNFVMKLDKNIE